jgi:hypothetical protein
MGPPRAGVRDRAGEGGAEGVAPRRGDVRPECADKLNSLAGFCPELASSGFPASAEARGMARRAAQPVLQCTCPLALLARSAQTRPRTRGAARRATRTNKCPGSFAAMAVSSREEPTRRRAALCSEASHSRLKCASRQRAPRSRPVVARRAEPRRRPGARLRGRARGRRTADAGISPAAAPEGKDAVSPASSALRLSHLHDAS